MTTLIKNIKELIQVRETPIKFVSGADMKKLPTLKNGYLLIEDGAIAAFGSMHDCPQLDKVEIIDASDKLVMPAWCDSHTHIVYAGNRETEFVDRINGLTYQEIANRGGGILNSAKHLEQVSEEQLFLESSRRLEEVMALGTGAIEIKSGYGLTVEAELKMLRVIQRLKNSYPLPIKATLLAAHALPDPFKSNKEGYLDLIIDELLPQVSKQHLADYIDIFCEEGYFDLEDTRRVLQAGNAYGLIPKIHVNQFNAFGGVGVGVKHNARSVDHLEVMNSEDIEVLKGTTTMPVALPNCSHFLSIPYTPARAIIDAGLPLALATDYNPGSSPSGNMNQAASLACIKMKMTPEEVINAGTINAAYAMGLEEVMGTITVGKKANLIITEPINSYAFMFYSFGINHINKVLLNGQRLTYVK